MKGKMRKLTAALLAGVMILSLFTGCGKEKTVAAVMDKDHVFKETPLTVLDNWDDVSYVITTGEYLYALENHYSYEDGTDEDGNYWYEETNEYEVTRVKLDGSDKISYKLDDSANDVNAYFYHFTADANGNIYGISNTWSETLDEDGNWNYMEQFHLHKYDETGKVIWSVLLNDFQEGEDYLWVESLYMMSDTEIGVGVGSVFVILSAEDGSLIEKDENLAGCTIYSVNENRAIVGKYGESNVEYYSYDLATKTLSEKYSLPGNPWSYTIHPSETYDVYLSDSQAVYGYNLGDEEAVEIMNYIDSDIPANHVYDVIPISDTEFIIGYHTIADYERCYSTMAKVMPEDVVEKKVITLGCYYLQSNYKQKVIEFNKTNPEYRIEVKEYSMYDSYENDAYTSGEVQLNNDILAGNVPDILLATNDLQMNNYQNKGLLYDLNKLFDKGDGPKRSDYLENILDAYESNGKLYRLPICFNVFTLTGKASEVGDDFTWTMDELIALYNSKPEGTQVFDTITRANFMDYSIQMSGDKYVNWETGECNFDSDSFIKILEFAQIFPEEINYDEIYGEDYDWNAVASQYRDGRTILQYTYLSELKQYTRLRQGDFGEDITYVGFPCDEGIGSTINSNETFCISAKSRYKDAAWEFISYFISEEYQSEKIYDFPILRSSYDKLIEDAKQKPYWIDENGEKIEYDETYWMGDTEIIINPSTDEDIEYVMNFIESLNMVYTYDADLMNIVNEEAAAFFSGQKSAKDVAAAIQSRASIYVSEKM